MMEWWHSLTALNQWFYVAAAFLSVFFLWQLVMALVGLAGGESVDDVSTHVDMSADHAAGDHLADDAAHETMAAFKLLSIRSVLAFFTMFTWAGALYLGAGKDVTQSLLYGIVWGTGAMVAVALLFHVLRRLTETGTARLSTSVGASGTVYGDIPAGGAGEVRVLVSGVMTHVRARAAGGREMKSGTKIRVARLLDATTVEVQPEDEPGAKPSA